MRQNACMDRPVIHGRWCPNLGGYSLRYKKTSRLLSSRDTLIQRPSQSNCRLKQKISCLSENGVPSKHDRGLPQPNSEVLKLKIGSREVTIESGAIGRQANGAVLVRDGETALYTTACCQSEAVENSFLPFGVHYTERFSAAGKTSGSFFRREGRPKQLEMITARLTDRPLRPMIKKGWNRDTQILSWLLSFDGEAQSEALSITAAGAALAISDIPLSKAVMGVRVGLINGEYIINPTIEEQQKSKLDLIMAGTSDAILMIEGFCNFLTDEQMLEALETGAKEISRCCKEIQAWAEKIGKPKITDIAEPDTTWDDKIASCNFREEMKDLIKSNLSKQERADSSRQLRDKYIESMTNELEEGKREEQSGLLKAAFRRAEAKFVRDLIVEEGVRSDGRGLKDVRPISSSCGLLPRTHGSTLFTRGETQAIAVTTLGSGAMSMIQDNVATTEEEKYQRFYLQYTFPPSSTGETGRVGFVGRREAGHGVLAERALLPIIPSEDEFPYSVRVESMITESNGSSSMASVCGGCLSLMDAGVPVKRMVAGVAMGLILNEDKSYRILTDILGSEDAVGDMDFKVAGDEEGITAFQMDIKVEGISLDIMKDALHQAKLGRQHILEEMRNSFPPPRNRLGEYTPKIVRVQVALDMVGLVIGTGGRQIRALREVDGVESIQILPSEEGIFEIVATTHEAAENCKNEILALVEEPEVNKTYLNCKVAGAEKFGLFVEFLPGRQGLLHVSELAPGEDLGDFDLDDKVDVTCVAIEGSKYRLSRRSSTKEPEFIKSGTVIENALVIDMKPYGAFVEYSEGKTSLVHISELYGSWEKKKLAVGDVISVMALEPNTTGKQAGKQNFSRIKALEAKALAVAKDYN